MIGRNPGPRGDDRFLAFRLATMVSGSLLALIGIARGGEGWWIPSALMVLFAGWSMTLVEMARRKRAEREARWEEEENEEGEEGEDGGSDSGPGLRSGSAPGDDPGSDADEGSPPP